MPPIISVWFTAGSSDSFVILYETRNSDPDNTLISIPLNDSYDYSFHWKLSNGVNGFHETTTGQDLIIDAGTPGVYELSILFSQTSSFPRLTSSGAVDRENWLEIRNWGRHVVKTMMYSYLTYENLKITATDSPVLDLESNDTAFNYTFGDIAETEFPSNFEFGTATALDHTFYNGKWVTFPSLNTSNIESFINTWYLCVDMESMETVDTSNAVSVEGMNRDCHKLTHGNHGSLVKCTSMYGTYRNCYAMTSYNDIDSMILTDGRYAFWGAGITEHKLFYTGLMTTASAMFRKNKVTSFLDYDWSELYYCDWTFAENYYLEDDPFPVMSFPKAKYMGNAFYACGSSSGGFKTITFSSPVVLDIGGIFRYSHNLLEVNCDFTTATKCGYAFYDCRKLGMTGSDFDFRALNLINAEDLTEAFNLNLTAGVNGMSTTRYSELLIWLEANNVKDNVPLGAGNSTYDDSAVSARDSLINRGWTITDGGLA